MKRRYRSMAGRAAAFMLAVLMCLSMLPSPAFALEDGEAGKNPAVDLKGDGAGVTVGVMAMDGASGQDRSGPSATGTIRIDAVPDSLYRVYRVLEAETVEEDGESRTRYTISAKSPWYQFFATRTLKDEETGEPYEVKGPGMDYAELSPAGGGTYEAAWNAGKCTDEGLELLAHLAESYAYGWSVSPDGITVSDGDIAGFDNVPAGYYLIVSGVGSLCELVTFLPEPGNTGLKLEDHSIVPEVSKQVWDNSRGNMDGHEFDTGEDTGWVPANDAHVGDRVWYRVTIETAQDSSKLTLQDYMDSGLTLDEDSFRAYRNGMLLTRSVRIDVDEDASDTWSAGDYRVVYMKNNILAQAGSSMLGQTGGEGQDAGDAGSAAAKSSEKLSSGYKINRGRSFAILFEDDLCDALAESETLTVVYSAVVNSHAVTAPSSNDNSVYACYGVGGDGYYAQGSQGVLSILDGFGLLGAADAPIVRSADVRKVLGRGLALFASNLGLTPDGDGGGDDDISDADAGIEPHMVIRHNISALNANRNLNKLSSGYRINRAGDDALGFRGSTAAATARTYVHAMTHEVWQGTETAPSGPRNGPDWTAGTASGKWGPYLDAPVGSDLYYRIVLSPRSNILQQAGQSMLGQANQVPQGVLGGDSSDTGEDGSGGSEGDGEADPSIDGKMQSQITGLQQWKPNNLVLKVLTGRVTVDYGSLEVWKEGSQEPLEPGRDYRLYGTDFHFYSDDRDPDNAEDISALMAVRDRLEHTGHMYYTFGIIFSNDLFDDWSENDRIFITYEAKYDDDAFFVDDDAAGHGIEANGHAVKFTGQSSRAELGVSGMDPGEFDALVSGTGGTLPRFKGAEYFTDEKIAEIEASLEIGDEMLAAGASPLARSDTTVYNYGFDISKTDGYGKFLEGAKFELRTDPDDPSTALRLVEVEGMASGANNLPDVIPPGGPLYRLAAAGDAGATTEIRAGLATVVGLDSGIYYVVETEAAPGYLPKEKADKVKVMSFIDALDYYASLVSAESQIRDTDMADEMVKFAKDNILDNTVENTADAESRIRGTAQSGIGTAERLNSGYRVNRAADDAAGLAISEKMQARLRGLAAGWANWIPIQVNDSGYDMLRYGFPEPCTTAHALFTAEKDEDGNIVSWTYGNGEKVFQVGATVDDKIGGNPDYPIRGGVQVVNLTGGEILEPAVKKEVWTGSGVPDIGDDAGWSADNTARIGSKVYYRTTVTAADKAVNYTLFDMMYPGLSFDRDLGVKVYLNGAELSASTNEPYEKDPETGALKPLEMDGDYRFLLNEDWEAESEGIASGGGQGGSPSEDLIDPHMTIQHNLSAMGITGWQTVVTASALSVKGATFVVKFSDGICASLEEGDELVVMYAADLNENARIGAQGNENVALLGHGRGTMSISYSKLAQANQGVLSLLQSGDGSAGDSAGTWSNEGADGNIEYGDGGIDAGYGGNASDFGIDGGFGDGGIDPHMVIQHNLTAMNAYMDGFSALTEASTARTFAYRMDAVVVDGGNDKVLDGATLKLVDAETGEPVRLVPYETPVTEWEWWSDLAVANLKKMYLRSTAWQLQDVLSLLQDGGDILIDDGTPGAVIRSYRPALPGETEGVVTEISAGILSFVGLSDGAYRLEETVQPDSYRKPLRPVEVEVKSQYAEDGGLSGTAMLAIGSGGLIPMTFGDSSLLDNGDGMYFTEGAGVPVYNYTGFALPRTGGTGTAPVYAAGFALALGSCVAAAGRRRRKTDRAIAA